MKALSNLTWQVKTLLATSSMAFLLILFCTAKLLMTDPLKAQLTAPETDYFSYDPPSSYFSVQKSRSEEASDWMQQLFLFNNSDLDGEALSKKYFNLMLAATALSAESTEDWEQRYWSDLAITYGETAKKASVKAGLHNLEEINARLLVAMALNFYQGSGVDEAALKKHYELIDKSHLFRSGFCQYSILRALQQDGIIQLPDFPKEINI